MRVSRLALLLAALLLPAGDAVAAIATGRYVAVPQPVEACGADPDDCTFLLLEGWIDVRYGIAGDERWLFEVFTSDLRLSALGGGEVELPLDAVGYEPVDGPTFRTAPSADGPQATFLLRPHGRSDRRFFRLTGDFTPAPGDPTYRFDVFFDGFDRGQPQLAQVARHDADDRLVYSFVVEVIWRDADGNQGHGVPIVENDRSVRFWFFHPGNPELQVKIVPACEPFGKYWVFVSGLTHLEIEVWVLGQHTVETDAELYRSPFGEPFQPVLDTQGFTCR